MAVVQPSMSTPKRLNTMRVALAKEFLKTFCEDEGFISKRRKVLRLRAGLREDDIRLVPKFRFIILEGKRATISEREVQSDHNFELILGYLASFAHDLPRRKELETCLAWASSHYRLNPWRRFEQHQAWAIVEAGTLMGAASWCMDRFQRNPGARPGHSRIETIKEMIRTKLQENNLLTPDGKRVASRGRGMSDKKSEKVLRLFLVWDSEGIAESEDKILEEIFESVDADDGDNDTDDDSGSSGDDRKKPKKGVKIEKKNKKRKKSSSSDDGSAKSVDSSGSEDNKKKKKKKKAKKETKQQKEKRLAREKGKREKEELKEKEKAEKEILTKGKKIMNKINDDISLASNKEKLVADMPAMLRQAIEGELAQFRHKLVRLRDRLQRQVDNQDVTNLETLIADAEALESQFKDFLSRANLK